MSITFQIIGFAEMRRELEAVSRRVLTGIDRTLENESSRVLQLSQDVVPVLTGELKASGKKTNVETEGGMHSVAIQYTADHAVFVHESGNPGSKFLENPLRDSEHGMLNRFAEDINLER